MSPSSELVAKRKLYRRSEDVPFIQTVGEFPFLYPDLLSVILGRTAHQVRSRGNRLWVKKHLGRIRLHDDSYGVPWLWYVRPTEYAKKCAPDAVAMWDKKRTFLEHDHQVSLIHFAIREFITDWKQEENDGMKETVDIDAIDNKTRQRETITKSFYPDARFKAHGTVFRLENQRAAQSSEGGTNAQDWKMACYNALLKDRKNEKVIFVLQSPGKVKAFLERYAEKYSYLWCWVTDIESILERPTESIFRCPHDERTYSFGDLAL